MIWRTLAAFSLMAVSALAACADERPKRLDRIGWLAGCWQRQVGERLMEEQWMAPRGKTMLGMNRTVHDGQTPAFEFMRIEERVLQRVDFCRASLARSATQQFVCATPSRELSRATPLEYMLGHPSRCVASKVRFFLATDDAFTVFIFDSGALTL